MTLLKAHILYWSVQVRWWHSDEHAAAFDAVSAEQDYRKSHCPNVYVDECMNKHEKIYSNVLCEKLKLEMAA